MPEIVSLRSAVWMAVGLIAAICCGNIALAKEPAQSPAKETPAIESKVIAKNVNSWDETPLPAYPTGRPEISIVQYTIHPGTQMPWHKHPLINAGVLLSGELTVVADGGKTLKMKAGDPIIELVDKWHYGKNEGTVPAVILVFYAGTPGDKLSLPRPSEETPAKKE